MATRETVFQRIKEAGHVPVLPEILVRLLEACDNQSTPLNQVASLIDKDPSLSYKVLQLVNSAYFGLKTTYSGVDQAVVYLGVNSVKNMGLPRPSIRYSTAIDSTTSPISISTPSGIIASSVLVCRGASPN